MVSKTIHAKIDRLGNTINFTVPANPDTTLSNWAHAASYEISPHVVQPAHQHTRRKLMSIVDTTTHLINKERMVHKV